MYLFIKIIHKSKKKVGKFARMNNMLTIRCKNTGRSHSVPMGFNLEQVYELLGLQMPYAPTSAKVNNKVEGLHYTLYNNKDIEFINITSESGLRTYTRSLFFVLFKAVRDLFPESRLRIETGVSNGYYCRVVGVEVTPDVVTAIRERMKQIVADDLPFHRVTVPINEAIDLFRSHGLEDKATLLENGSGDLYSNYYTLDMLPDYFYGALLIRTSQITLFDVVPYGDGLLLRIPDPKRPEKLLPMANQDKIFNVINEQHRLNEILEVSTLGEFNIACKKGRSNEIINISEALQEKKISKIADRIAENRKYKLILISGPSSSGKTTFSKRLGVQLMACGLHPVSISMDDYFVDRVKTPLDGNGEYDFENIKALNIPLFNEQMNALLSGEEIELPRYNFQTGKSERSGRYVRMKPNGLVVLEGIHALNPMLTEGIEDDYKFKIFASALTTVLIDHHNYIPTTDIRLLRRIVRDFKYRGFSALETIRRWPSVCAGEEKWIYPFQEQADEMINTALLYELSAVRNEARTILEQVPEHEAEYSEAYRLRKFLNYVIPISAHSLPPTSLMREFIGGSSFKY